jgi:hypothetical protein
LGASGQVLDDYSVYNIVNRSFITCVDFAFSFVGLYGKGSQVIFNEGHAFVLIGSLIVEPQDLQGKQFSGVDYSKVYYIPEIYDKDIQKIKSFFL